MNTQLRRTFYLFSLGFVALVGVLAYWQVYAREDLANNPSNGLQTRRLQETPRGVIFAGDGKTVLAQSEKTGGGNTYKRVYPQGEPFADVVGYWSTRYGASGLEIGENNNLSGSGEPKTLDELINQFSGGPPQGNNITTTLDPELQREAYNQLANSNTGRGAVAVFDPKTGETLALASYPSYDPNSIDQNFEQFIKDPNAPLVNRATQGLYPPGSTFKVITSSAALEAGVKPTDRFYDNGTYDTPGYTVINYKRERFGDVTFADALVYSINTIFSKIAVEIVGPERLAAMAQRYGFGREYKGYPIPLSPSSLGRPVSEWVPGNTAPISFGQDRVVTNVFEMGLVAATVANGGTMMQPRLVREVRSPDGLILDRPTPRALNDVIPQDTASTLNQMMQNVVQRGELVDAQIQGVKVAGKTGTAEAPPGEPHSWFVSFAPAGDPKIAVAVMVEHGGIIGPQGDAQTPAVTIAGNLMRAYLKRPAPSARQPASPPGVPGGNTPRATPAQPGTPAQPAAPTPVDPFAPFRQAAPQQQQQQFPPAQPFPQQQQPVQPFYQQQRSVQPVPQQQGAAGQ